MLAVHPGARGKPRIALITASGTIVQGPVKPGAVPPAQKLIDATGLAAELAKLEKDPMVRPGIWACTVFSRAAFHPIVGEQGLEGDRCSLSAF